MFPQQLPAVTPRVVSRLALLVPQVSLAPGCWRTPCTTDRWLPASSSWPLLRCEARLLVARVHQYRHNKGFLEHKHVAQPASSTETCDDICAMQWLLPHKHQVTGQPAVMYESRKILNDAGVTQGQGKGTGGGWGLKGKEGP